MKSKLDKGSKDLMIEFMAAMRISLDNYRKQGIEPTLAQWIEAYERTLK